ncbi:MAG: metallophosphoesterase family protein [Candidatus Bathyarchaeia archaeon]
MVRLAHLSDTHLGYKQYGLEERERDIYACLEEIGDKILEAHVDVVVHSGDLFDSARPAPQAYRAFKRFLKKIGERAKVFAVLGDHDRPKSQGLAPHFLFDDQIQILGVNWAAQQQVFSVGGREVLVAGLSNVSRTYRAILQEELRKLAALDLSGKVAVLLLHEGIDRFLPYEGAFELGLDEVPKNFDYVAMGHLHSRIKASVGEGELAYAGSSEIISRSEVDEWRKNGKGFFIVDVERGNVDVQPVNLECVRPQLEVNLKYAYLSEGLEDLATSLGGFKKQPIVHVKVEGKNIDRQNVHAALSKRLAGLVLQFRPEFEDEATARLPEVKSGNFQVSQVIQEYFKEPDVAGLALELWRHLRAGDVDEAKAVAEDYYQRGKQA